MNGAVLAGGRSVRMGFNKAFIPFNGQPLIKGIVDIFCKVFDKVSVIANDTVLYEPFGLRVVSDIYRNAGSLGGIYTALFHSTDRHCFVAACDMPFLRTSVIEDMISEAYGWDVIVPYIDHRYHPLHAVYSRRCMRFIEAMIAKGDLRVTGLFGEEKLRVKRLDEAYFSNVESLLFVENVNTVEDLERAVEELKSLKEYGLTS